MAKRGRPRDDSVQDFSVHETPEEGLYLVRFTVSGKAYCAVVRYRVRMHKHTVETLSPLQTFREILERPYPDPAEIDNPNPDAKIEKKLPRLGIGSNDSIARRLTKMFRETVIIRNLNRPGN